MEPRCLAFLGAVATLLASCSANLESTDFLEKYGYLSTSNGSDRSVARSPEDMDEAMRHFQRFAGLTPTGILDEETEDKMRQSRCGVKDVFNGETRADMPADLRQTTDKWPKNVLTWSIKKFSKTSAMSRKRQLFAIREGFRRWAGVTHLTFREVKGKADIELSFERLEHGDKDSFDGRGSTLAHAFAPVDGRTHFDDDEEWTEGVDHGTNLEHVATHEIGHALGLWHLPGIYPVMSPYYPGYIENFKLHRYDILEIQRRYGKREINGTTELPKFCGQRYRTIKAVMRVDKKVDEAADYIFVDQNMVISGSTGRKLHVRRLFLGGPKSVDAAAYSQLTNTAYLFKGQKVWAFLLKGKGRFVRKYGFPKDLHNSKLRKPEAAIRINDTDGMETILLIKEGRVVEWMPYHERLAPGIGFAAKELFPGIPGRMDAAVSGDNIVNFIVGQKFYANNPTGRRTTKRSIPIKNLFICAK